MARPRKGEEKGASTGVAARVSPKFKKRFDGIVNQLGRQLSECIVEALEQWCDRQERKGKR